MSDSRSPPTVLAYSVKELASATRVSEGKIWAELSTGELESFQVGDRRLISLAQAQTWIERKARMTREREDQKRQRVEQAKGGIHSDSIAAPPARRRRRQTEAKTGSPP